MKRFLCGMMALLFTTTGCSFLSTPVISNVSKPSFETSVNSKINETSSVSSDQIIQSCEFLLTTEHTFEVNVMTTTDWQSFEDNGSSATKTFLLTFPENWIRDGEGAPTFHDQYTDIKIFESITAVKLAAGFDFAGSFQKENFEDSMSGTSVIGDVKIATLAFAEGDKTYTLIVQSVVPEGGGEVQIDRWYPYLYVIVDGGYAYCMQFYSLDNPVDDTTDTGLFNDIMSTFKVVS